MTPDEVRELFTFHPAERGGVVAAAHERIRTSARSAAIDMLAIMPPSREASLAITSLQEAMMWGNAAIANHGIRSQDIS